MNLPLTQPVTTNILRQIYGQKDYSFGSPDAPVKVVLVGSCRIVPFVNFLRVHNALAGDPFELICFNPVEMWDGPGHEVSDCVNRALADFRFGTVDFLICEHLQYCGAMNTVRSEPHNLFDSLGCAPKKEIRLPNWNAIHIFDAETAIWDPAYGTLDGEHRVNELRNRTAANKAKFLRYCGTSSYPELEQWAADNWLDTRLGWSSNHPSLALTWKMFELIAADMGVEITPELSGHPLCSNDTYKATGIALNDVDREANHWNFQS